MEKIYSFEGFVSERGKEEFYDALQNLADNDKLVFTLSDDESTIVVSECEEDEVAQAVDIFFGICKTRKERMEDESKRETERAMRAYSSVKNLEYIVLESGIPYDWDDYGVWADTLFNLETRAVEVCKYGHGSGSCATKENSLFYSYAIILGIVEERDIREALYTRFFGGRNVSCISPDMIKDNGDNLCIPCKVVGGAKFKGECFLMSFTREKVRYGYDNYKQIVKVYDPKSNEIKTVNSFEYLEFSDDVVKKVSTAFMEQRHQHCMTMNLFSLIHEVAYSISYSACDSRTHNEFMFDHSFADFSELFDKIDTTGAVDVEEQKAAKKNEEFKKSKIAELIEWAKSKKLHDESEASLREFAESIFARKYAYR